MKLFKKLRKGFTLIELVVVIAVIAILAAVSVVSYVAITNKAKESNDHMMIDQINTSVEASSIPNRKATLHEVLEDLKEDSGFGVEKLKPELKDAEFVYSYSMNKFAYWKKDKVVYPKDVAESSSATGEDLWFFVDIKESDNALSGGHSYYAKSAPANKVITVDGGFDVGSQSFSSITYANNSSAKEVVIRTNSSLTSLTIDAASDIVKHYGEVGSLNIIAVANASYHEFGQVAFAEIKTGRIVLESKSEVEHLHLTATEGNFVDITVAKASDVEMPDFSRDPVDLSSGSKLIVALQDGTNTTDAKDYVWLTEVGIYEQVTLGTADAAGTNYAAASSSQEKKDAAQQIANNITFSEGGQDYKVTATKVNEEWTYEVKTEAGQEATGYSASVSGTTVSVTNISTSSAVQTNNENGMTPAEKEISKAENIAGATAVEAAESGETKDAKAIIIISPTSAVQYATIFELRDIVNNGNDLSGYTVKLCGDIDMLGVEWTEFIGTSSHKFKGTFDGQGHKISNLSNNGIASTEILENNTTGNQGSIFGLFGYVGGNTIIKNLEISVNAYSNSANGWGAVVACAKEANSSLTLYNVTASGILNGKDKAGGLVGDASGDSITLSFEKCNNYVDVTGDRAAGIVCCIQNASSATFIDCHNYGTITSTYSKYCDVGGITAQTSRIATFANCTNEGTLDGAIMANIASIAPSGATYNSNTSTWSATSSTSLGSFLAIKGLVVNEVSMSLLEAVGDAHGIHNAFDGIYYNSNNSYSVFFYGDNRKENTEWHDLTAKYTAEEWNAKTYASSSQIQVDSSSTMTIILQQDLNWSALYSIGTSRTLIIDLNGYTLTATSSILSGGGATRFTFKNGTINAEGVTLVSGSGYSEVNFENVTGSYIDQ